MKCKIKLTEGAILPTKAHRSDVGYDLYALSVVDRGRIIEVNTGVSLIPEEGYWVAVAPRSSISNSGLVLCNSLGIIDPSYTGEIKLRFYKADEDYTLPGLGDRVAQVIIMKLHNAELESVDSLEVTDRGDGGFGSSGT
jgi:dUTP pyrophosphatase